MKALFIFVIIWRVHVKCFFFLKWYFYDTNLKYSPTECHSNMMLTVESKFLGQFLLEHFNILILNNLR